MDKEQIFEVGTKVSKTSGDYTFHGEIVAAFKKRSGQIRYVVENEDGILHIFSGKQLSINNEIKLQIEKIRGEQKLLNARIVAIQNKCQHPNIIKTSKSDTGNYDPSQDRYYEELTCPDCGFFATKTIPAGR